MRYGKWLSRHLEQRNSARKLLGVVVKIKAFHENTAVPAGKGGVNRSAVLVRRRGVGVVASVFFSAYHRP